ncbi:MAG: hypothetical protein ACI9OJ_001110 [Myxococcota bacterium]|jgi:hypothetical protein
MLTRNLIIGLVFAVAIASSASAQTTDPSKQAVAHAQNGSRALAAGDNHKALAEFVLAYAYQATPERLLEIARVYEAFGNRAVALEVYHRVSATGSGPAASAARQKVAALVGAQPAAVAGSTIQLTVMPPGAEVYVDGVLRGRAPLPPMSVSAGPHRLEVRLDGYKNTVQSVNVVAGQPMSQLISLSPGQATPVQSAGSHAGGQTNPTASGTLLRIEGVPGRARVTLNGRNVPVTGTVVEARVAPGVHRIVVVAPRMAPFERTITVATGQAAVVRVPTAGRVSTPAASTGSIAGSWFGAFLEQSMDRSISTSATLELQANMTGKLTTKNSLVLATWKRKQCGGRAQASWSTEYSVRAVKAGSGIKLSSSSGRQIGCDCEGMCPNDGSIDLDLLVAPSNAVMVGKDLVFQRRTGAEIPSPAVKAAVEVGKISGKWHLAYGDASDNMTASLNLAVSGGQVTGMAQQTRTSQIARWRAKECNGQTMVEATYHFSVAGEPNGHLIKFSFDREKQTGCPCKPAACAAASATVGLPTETLQMTLDGNHLVTGSMLISRQ